jgi:hypothetical protein
VLCYLFGSLFYALAILLLTPELLLTSSTVLAIVANGLVKFDVNNDETLRVCIAFCENDVVLIAPDKSFKLICCYYSAPGVLLFLI